MSLKPAFLNKNIAIVCSSNDNYVPYLDTLICSIVSNASNDNNYDIVVLDDLISDENKEIIKKKQKRNISIRFFDILQYIDDKDMVWPIPEGRSWTRATYYRMLVPYVLSEYKKVIYLDCDVINLWDIAELYKTDIQDYLLGAVRICGCVVIAKNNMLNGTYSYNHYFLPEVELENYFNAGVLLFNTEKFRETFSRSHVLKCIANQKYELVDQDVLNVLCANQVKYIDAGWNWYPYASQELANVMELCPDNRKSYYFDSSVIPKNIHYTIPVKPWLEPYGVYSFAASLFWKYAIHSAFFEKILEKMQKYQEEKKESISLIKRTFEELYECAKNKKLFLYGFGNRGKEFWKLFGDKIPIAGIIDKDKSKQQLSHSAAIMELEDLMDIDKEKVAIIVSNDNFEDIVRELRIKGFTNLFLYKYLAKRDWIAWNPDIGNFKEIEYAGSILNDKKSIDIYWNIIQKREQIIYDRNIKYLDIYEGNTYFRDDVYHIFDEEIYVDIGSGRGLTIEKFKKYVDGKYKKIISFEENKDCFVHLKANTTDNNVYVYNIKLSNEDEENVEIKYKEETVKTIKLDSFIKDEKVTFIKVNVQNTMDVLSGAKKTIMRFTPKLAISVSNNYDDLWNVPIFLKKLVPDYKFYLRHHSPGKDLSVIYASVSYNYTDL